VAVSHHHADHYGGTDAVIRQFHPRYFLATDSPHTTPNYLRLLTLVKESGMQAVFPTDQPRRLDLGPVTLWVLPQPPVDPTDENDNSVGIRVQYGSFSALLTGDNQARERAFWEANAPQFVQDCMVLKLAHHGSRNGADARWLRPVRPRLAVASLGAGNEYGHPHPETLALLDRLDIPLIRTDRDGTVTVVSDGKEWAEAVSGKSPRAAPDEQVARADHRTRHSGGVKRPGRVIDINSASQQELEALPGIGPALARRIIEGRPYRRVEDLRRVKGIGEKRLAEIRAFVTAK
jgi:beta-lactamase superfamily II metal-dependent hydrolase